jgi:PadR family transcriptional regulator, regulatory protein AphA
MQGVRRLTTTSYAILGLLTVRPWSAYEITEQMKRGLRFSWPRAETRIYQEPKNLVSHGLAEARTETTGRRQRTVYSVTPAGRQAFRAWLEQESAPPQHQSEALLRVTFAESGSKEALLATLRGLAGQAREFRDQLGDQAEEYLTTGGAFPERLHLIALVGRFLIGYVSLLEEWATWAESEVKDWPAAGPADAVRVPWEVIDLIRERARRLDAGPGGAPDAGVC